MKSNASTPSHPLYTNPWIEEYLQYMIGMQGRSLLTVKEYRYDLVMFFRYLLESRGLADPALPFAEQPVTRVDLPLLATVELRDLHAFIGWMGAVRHASAANRSRKCAALRSFFRYLHVKTKHLESNPAAELESPKLEKRLPRYLEIEQSRALLEASTHKKNDFLQLRDYCILTLFLNCGLRLAELCGLNREDWREEKMRVMGKGKKERTVYLNAACIDALQAYDSVRETVVTEREQAFFVTRSGDRLSRAGVQYLVKNLLRESGLDPRLYSVHKLRHTAATLLYKYGKVDIRALQQILGHSSVSTTEIYTHLDAAGLQQAVERNPLADTRLADVRGRGDSESL